MQRNISRSLSRCIEMRNKAKTSVTVKEKEIKEEEVKTETDESPYINPMGIQMLSSTIHSQVFKNVERPFYSGRPLDVHQEELVKRSLEHLKKYDLGTAEPSILPEVNFQLPKLHGKNIDEHFKTIAEQYVSKYLPAAQDLASKPLPPLPKIWNFQEGWTKYLPNGKFELVHFPTEDALIFDVEVCVTAGPAPTLAVAASQTAWYSWCSEHLTKEQFVWSQKIHLKDLIPLETRVDQCQFFPKSLKERVIIGHNVGYDRARIKEQYFLRRSKMRFLDTMSLHIAIAGMTSYQRILINAKGSNTQTKDIKEAKSKMSGSRTTDWMHISSLNGLADVYKLYCGETIKKDVREVFVNGTINDVRKDFQNLISYCANDVYVTHAVCQKLLPLFLERFPHPVTLAGMLEMSTAYLPINNNWENYLDAAQTVYDDLEKEMKMYLMHLADDACELLHEEQYKQDIWLKDLDWSTASIKFKKNTTKLKSKKKTLETLDKNKQMEDDGKSDRKLSDMDLVSTDSSDNIQEEEKDLPTPKHIQNILDTAKNMYKVQPLLPGYPAWYRKLCAHPSDHEDWQPGPYLISTQMQITPKLLRLKWDGYPLHYTRKHGWGYLVPEKKMPECNKELQTDGAEISSITNPDVLWESLEKGIGDPVELSNLWRRYSKKPSVKNAKSKKTEDQDQNNPKTDVDVPGYLFFPLPHKDGPQHRVGNPLAKDYLSKIESGILQAGAGIQAEMVLKLSKTLSYWRNASKRIKSQMAVWLKKNELTRSVLTDNNFEESNNYGAILPQIVTAGTLTRRAVESTWLTASNAYPDRVGSELKSMIQAPPGFSFVGADVDSQELWIASVLGDSYFTGIHGGTAFSWMTLQGKKSDGTDMHSRTANTVGITRNQAKVLNYSRIYGAGQPFAQQLLMQFNPRLSMEEAKIKSQIMFSATKGVRGYILNEMGEMLYKDFKSLSSEEFDEKKKSNFTLTRGEILQMIMFCNSTLSMDDIVEKYIWMGGTESAMFNKLEEIAHSEKPQTPVLSCRISQALEPAYVNNNFMTSRINWVVQSSAVDYLHMLLTSMHWLCKVYNIEARFSISIHDEVRYLVKNSDKYRAALALQIANLLTRSMFAYHLKMYDLPQSVAFFSSVEIDPVLRKEVTMDCKTPSNPHGLSNGYGIEMGEGLDIYEILLKTNNGSLKK